MAAKVSSKKTIKRVLVANRGEIAVRIMQSLKAMGIESVAVYSEADANALHVCSADYAYPLGGNTSQESYLQQDKIISIAKQAKVDAIHPGYGFLSENAAFVEACEKAKLLFIGPSANVMRQLGDKINAKKIATKANVPTVPGFSGDLAALSEKELKKTADNIGFPILVKASGGGGGKGMRVVNTFAELPQAIESAQREALAAFNNPEVFLERYLQNPRHIEVQLIADTHGNVLHLFERDCSIQRRHQKILEEAPAPLLPPALKTKLHQAAIALAQAVGYTNAGTVEFLVDGDEFFFLEMNTRLQVEHPVTELITGVDLVAWQLLVAQSQPLPQPQTNILAHGHAIEVRLCAEDPNNQFFPASGKITQFSLPHLPFVRLDSGVRTNDSISIYYDSMLGKLIAWGNTREDCLSRLQHALETLQVNGLATNTGFLRRLVQHPAVMAGGVSTHWLTQQLETLITDPNKTSSNIEATTFNAIAALVAMLNSPSKPVTMPNTNHSTTTNSPWTHF